MGAKETIKQNEYSIMDFNNHSDSLFHYTGKGELSALISILEEGFKFGYCQDYLYQDRFVAFPMICFCDIPLNCCIEHRNKYGGFGIGLSKQYMIDNFKDWFGPVYYYLSDSSIEAAFSVKALVDEKRTCAVNFLSKYGIKTDDSVSFDGEKGLEFLEYKMESIDYQKKAIASIALMKPYSTDNRINYDECEWRLFIPDGGRYKGTNEICRWFWNKDEYNKEKEAKGIGKNKKVFYNGFKLTIPFAAIKYIIVPSQEEACITKERIKSLKKVMGRTSTKENINQLVNKVVVISL